MSRLKKLLKKIDEIVENISIEEIDERIKIDEEEMKAMLSKEKIARAKERISKSLNDVWFATLYSQEENEEDERILLAYIKQLEKELYLCTPQIPKNSHNKYISYIDLVKEIVKKDEIIHLIVKELFYNYYDDERSIEEIIKDFEKKVEESNAK